MTHNQRIEQIIHLHENQLITRLDAHIKLKKLSIELSQSYPILQKTTMAQLKQKLSIAQSFCQVGMLQLNPSAPQAVQAFAKSLEEQFFSSDIFKQTTAFFLEFNQNHQSLRHELEQLEKDIHRLKVQLELFQTWIALLDELTTNNQENEYEFKNQKNTK